MESGIDTLKQSRVFGSLDTAHLKVIASLLESRRTGEGEILASANERASHFFILVSGTLLNAMEDGRSYLVSTPGDFIGLEALSEKGTYKSTLTVLSKGEVLTIKRDAFLDIIQEDTDSAAAIIDAWNDYLTDEVPFIEQATYSDTDYHY